MFTNGIDINTVNGNTKPLGKGQKITTLNTNASLGMDTYRRSSTDNKSPATSINNIHSLSAFLSNIGRVVANAANSVSSLLNDAKQAKESGKIDDFLNSIGIDTDKMTADEIKSKFISIYKELKSARKDIKKFLAGKAKLAAALKELNIKRPSIEIFVAVKADVENAINESNAGTRDFLLEINKEVTNIQNNAGTSPNEALRLKELNTKVSGLLLTDISIMTSANGLGLSSDDIETNIAQAVIISDTIALVANNKGYDLNAQPEITYEQQLYNGSEYDNDRIFYINNDLSELIDDILSRLPEQLRKDIINSEKKVQEIALRDKNYFTKKMDKKTQERHDLIKTFKDKLYFALLAANSVEANNAKAKIIAALNRDKSIIG